MRAPLNNRRKVGTKLEVFFLLIILLASLLAWRTSSLTSKHDFDNYLEGANAVSIKLQEFAGGNHVADAAVGPIDFESIHNNISGTIPESNATTIAATTTKQKQNQTQNHTKPYFILHVGPPKTATTYLQCNLDELAKELASEDSYYYLGKVCPSYKHEIMDNNETSIPAKFLILGLNDGQLTNRGSDLLMKRLEHHHARGNHVIYSNEAFAARLGNSNATWASLQNLLNEWQVRVVVTYRHYFDWIRSFYYQRYKAEDKNQPSYVGFLEFHLQQVQEASIPQDGTPMVREWGHHLSVTTAKKFAKHFEVQYQNLHTEQDLAMDFVCRILPSAHKTCQKLQTGVTRTNDHRSARTAESFNGYRIVEATFDQGFFFKDRKEFLQHKKKLAKAVNQHIQDIGIGSLQDYLECPSPTLVARLLNASYQFEKELFELSHKRPMTTMEQETAQKDQLDLYQKNAAANKYCDLDPELILKNETWVAFLKELNDKITKKK